MSSAKNNTTLKLARSATFTTIAAVSCTLISYQIATAGIPLIVAQANINSNGNQNSEQRQINAFANKYTYEDAERLAKFWGQATPWDAKLKMGSLILSGQNSSVKQALYNAKQSTQQEEERQIDAFADNYTYQDAELLAKFWGQATPWDAKLKIGNLVLRGQNSSIQQALRNAKKATREEAQINAFADNYTYQDAERLAKFWGQATPWDAKLKIGSLILSGRKSSVRQALKDAL